MCDVCDKSWYYDSVIHHSDAGYGDDDYDTTYQNVLATFICPACGKLRPSAEKVFGSKDKALAFIISQNMEDDLKDEEYFEKVKEILKAGRVNRLDRVLKQNNLTLENEILKHSCGCVILAGFRHKEGDESEVYKIEGILKRKGTNFCPTCGKKILPFQCDLEDSPLSKTHFGL